MGTAAWMVWTHGGFEARKLPLTLYGIQLLLNLAWNPLFFVFHNLDLAFWDALGEYLPSDMLCPPTGVALVNASRDEGHV